MCPWEPLTSLRFLASLSICWFTHSNHARKILLKLFVLFEGPTGDHTTGSGIYMYVDASSGNQGTQAHLESGLIQQSSATCEMTMYYYMNGEDIGVMQVCLMQIFPTLAI